MDIQLIYYNKATKALTDTYALSPSGAVHPRESTYVSVKSRPSCAIIVILHSNLCKLEGSDGDYIELLEIASLNSFQLGILVL